MFNTETHSSFLGPTQAFPAIAVLFWFGHGIDVTSQRERSLEWYPVAVVKMNLLRWQKNPKTMNPVALQAV